MFKEYLTKKDLCELFNISEVTAWRWMTKGLIPYYRFGRTVRFQKDEIRKFVAKNHNSERNVHGQVRLP